MPEPIDTDATCDRWFRHGCERDVRDPCDEVDRLRDEVAEARQAITEALTHRSITHRCECGDSGCGVCHMVARLRAVLAHDMEATDA